MKNLEDEIYRVHIILKNIVSYKKEAVKSQNIIDASPDYRHTEYIKRTINDKETYIRWVYDQIDRLQECKTLITIYLDVLPEFDCYRKKDIKKCFGL